MRSQDGEVFQHSRFTCNCEFPASSLSKNHMRTFFLCGCSSCPSTTAGWLLEKKKNNLKTRHDKKKVQFMQKSLIECWLANRYLQWRVFFCLQEEKRWFQTLSWFSHSCLVWIYLSVMNYFKCHSIGFKGGNYFSAPWNSTNPLLGVCDTSFVTPLVTAAFFYQVFRKLRVMHAAKQPLKQRPRLLGSLTMRLLRSGTTDEQSLVSYRAPR